MTPGGAGPSSDAWGRTLTAPQLVSHQGLLLAFAREVGQPTNVVYFKVMDPQQAAGSTDDTGWNGWYRYSFPGGPALQPVGTAWQDEQPPPELRLAGMDLLTVDQAATSVAPADASFQVQADDRYLLVLRPSVGGTLYLNRLVLKSSSEEVFGVEYDRYALEPAWEVRYQRSRVRDVPLDATDTQSSVDLTGAPFVEPTIELSRVAGAAGGAFGVARVPTADPAVTRWYVACTAVTGVRLFSFAQSEESVTDFTESAVAYTPLLPGCDGQSLPPVDGLAPALVMYAEQDPVTDASGNQVEVQRAARLMLAFAVTGSALGGGLDVATAVYDFGLDPAGLIPDLAATEQSVTLVDGVVTGGVFQPDVTSPGFPTAGQAPQVTRVVDGQVVTSLLLGQVQPHTDLSARMAEDGLVHLYYGGPVPTAADLQPGWRGLTPGEPQAMVAQFDPRVSRVAIEVPWTYAAPAEQPAGKVQFVARQSGPVMSGATVAVTDASLGAGVAAADQADLCDVTISYPAATGLGTESWTGVPREVSAFAAVLNGQATDDSADPAALDGDRPFFDFAGTQALARLPVPLAQGDPVGFLPAAVLVSQRTTVPLSQVTVDTAGTAARLTMTFTPASGVPLSAVWPELPAVLDSWADILGGSADPSVYPYTAGAGTTGVFGLTTDAYQIDAPVLLRPTGTDVDLSSLTIALVPSSAGANLLDVTFCLAGVPTTVPNVPADVTGFTSVLGASPALLALQLMVDSDGVSGNVLATVEPVGPMDLRGLCALFDLVLPNDDLTGCSLPSGSHTTGFLKHQPAGGPAPELTRLAGFACVPERPADGIPAYVGNFAAEVGAVTVNRQLRDGVDPVAGAWIRATPQLSCTFDGTDNVNVPLGPAVADLQPQWEWTLDAWVQPSGSAQQRLVTFHDEPAEPSSTAPSPDYRIALDGQDVVGFSSYAKRPGQPDSSYFQTGTSVNAGFLPAGAFTWECWVQPQTTPAPAGVLGGLVQVHVPGQSVDPFSIALDDNRRVVLRYSPDGVTAVDLQGVGSVPAMSSDGLPTWTHLAVTGSQTTPNGPWTVTFYLDATPDAVFTDVALQQNQATAYLIVGRNTADDVSAFAKMAALRCWNDCRTAAEIRRTAFSSLTGAEVGLLGCWPMTKLEPGGVTQSYLHNIARGTGSDWDAATYQWSQPVGAVQDDYFLSVVASVAGLPTVEAHAVLPNDRWNHLAVVFRGGGALNLNPASRFGTGRYDWMRCPVSEDLNVGSVFAVDAWVQLPGPIAQDATIMSHWAWDEAPQDQCYQLAVSPAGNLELTVSMYDSDQGDIKTDKVTSSGVDLADGTLRHVAAVFVGKPAENREGATATYAVTLYADGKVIGSKTDGTVGTTTLQLVTSQTDVLVGRTNAAPPGAEQAVESLGLFRGTLGQVRFWTTAPALSDLFGELSPRRPRFGPPPGLAALWAFREQDGTVAADSIGGNDGILTSSAPWASLRATSTLEFVANGAPVSSVVPYGGTMPEATNRQFTLGAPAESGVPGLTGHLGQVSLWGVARGLETIRDQQYTPRTGDEEGLLACWNFSAGGADLTGGGNNPDPAIDPARIRPDDAPVSNEGALVRNVYGGQVTDLSACTPGRLGVGSYVKASATGTRQATAVLKRQYVLDPNQSAGRPIDVGLIDLVYVGQVQTEPTLIGYIEGAPPVPSENLSRPYYLAASSPLFTAYTGASSVTLTQQGSEKIAYSSSRTSTTDIDFKAALGIFGIQSSAYWDILLVQKSAYDLKNTVQAVASAKATFGATEGTDLSGEWTIAQRDTIALKGDWEPFEADIGRYLNPAVGRRFVPANLGYALVESLTADMFAMVFHSTGAAVGTVIIPDLSIPPDRNVLVFPMNDEYTKNGTLDGKVGLVNDPQYLSADVRRGSYFRPTEAYGLAASIEAQNERRQSVASQFDAIGRGRQGRQSLADARAGLPVDFESEPAAGGQPAVPATGIANRYVWSADKGLHVEQQGFAGVSSRSYTGWRNHGGGAGIKAGGEFFFYLGFNWSLDLLATHMVDVHVGLKEDTQQSVALDVVLDVESYLPAWDPEAPAVYGAGKGAYKPGAGAGKVQQYRFFSFLLPASRANADQFDRIVDPNWKRLSNDPTARAVRELGVANPVWRVMHRVTYVQRVPPPVASRPVYSQVNTVAEPVNLPGNAELLALIAAQIPVVPPTPAQVGAAVAKVLNPAPVAAGQYPPSILEQTVPWWGSFLAAARPTADGPGPNPKATALLNALNARVVGYVRAGYRTGVLPPTHPEG